MEAVIELLQSLVNVVASLRDLVMALVHVILPWLPLIAWIGYWGLCVNWVKAHDIIWRRGGFIGVVLLMFIATLVWGSVSPPIEGTHTLFYLTVSNYVGKFVFVTMLTCIALICGSVQMSGTFGSLVDFSDEDKAADGHGHALLLTRRLSGYLSVAEVVKTFGCVFCSWPKLLTSSATVSGLPASSLSGYLSVAEVVKTFGRVFCSWPKLLTSSATVSGLPASRLPDPAIVIRRH